ncbi:MAG: hypothetical protein MAG715_01152 [Methanonatronarchaeales archaeon]|nr:hypothetical protein [Methanonatronarchaeales archaeon]
MKIAEVGPGGGLATYGAANVLLLSAGYLVWGSTSVHGAVSALLVASALTLLAAGSFRPGFRLPGWVAMAAYWALQPMQLYHRDLADVVNAGFAALAVPFFLYLAYRELLGDDRALRFAAGMSVVAGGGYFALYYAPVLGDQLRYAVAYISRGILSASTAGNVGLAERYTPGHPEYMPIIELGNARIGIILACTGIQSILIFVSGILVTSAPAVDKARASLATVPTIFGLNLLRVSGEAWGIDYLMRRGWSEVTAYNFLENGVAKVASLVALFVLAYVVFALLPSLRDDVMNLVSLPKRGGPLERAVAGIVA